MFGGIFRFRIYFSDWKRYLPLAQKQETVVVFEHEVVLEIADLDFLVAAGVDSNLASGKLFGSDFLHVLGLLQ